MVNSYCSRQLFASILLPGQPRIAPLATVFYAVRDQRFRLLKANALQIICQDIDAGH
jgi:hypothetical protein